MKIILTIFLLMYTIYLFSQEGGYYIVDTTNSSIKSIRESKNGADLHPNGTYRVMSIFVNIIYDLTPWRDPLFNQNTPHWPGSLTEGFNTGNPTYFLQYLDTTTAMPTRTGSFTRRYSESSFDSLRVIGDYMVVNIKQSSISSDTTFSQYQLINAVISYINANGGYTSVYGHDGILHYDYITVGGGFGSPKTLVPNNKIDYTQFLIRNSTIYDTTIYNPNPTLQQYFYGDLRCGWGNVGNSYNPIKMGLTQYPLEKVSVQAICASNLADEIVTIESHEFVHTLFGGNNMHTSGGHHYGGYQVGTFLGKEGGYGLMGNANSGLTSCNGFERWRMGWYSPNYNSSGFLISARNISNTQSVSSDITKSMGAQSFILRDFVTTGDVIRIKLPYQDNNAKNQYIWLENHQVGSNNKLDFLHYYTQGGCRPQGLPGVYAYIQVGKDSILSNDYSILYPSYEADNLMVISAEGNWDHERLSDSTIACVAWGYQNRYKQIKSNSLNGEQDQTCIFYNTVVNELDVTHGPLPFLKHKYNGVYQNNIPHLGDNYDAFTGTSVMDIGSNPSPTNIQTYYMKKDYNTNNIIPYAGITNQKTIYLTGLKITMTDQQNGTYRVDVIWDDYNVKNNVRWTGSIVNQERVNLLSYDTIHLDQSYTAIQKNRDTESGVFAPTTIFTCKNNSNFTQQANSIVIVDNKSTFKLESGSKDTIKSGAKLIIRNNSKLLIETGSVLFVEDGGQVIIEGTGKLDYQGGTITLNGSNAKLEIAGNLTIAANKTFTFSGSGYVKFSSTASSANNITANAGSAISLTGTGINNKMLEIAQDRLTIPANLASFSLSTGKVVMAHSSGQIYQSNTSATISVSSVKFTPSGTTRTSYYGLRLFNASVATISNCIFEKGSTGIYATISTDSLNVTNTSFYDCYRGILLSGRYLTLTNCTSTYCMFGIYVTNAQSGTSVFTNYTANNNTYGLYHGGAASGHLYVLNSNINSNSGHGIYSTGSFRTTIRCSNLTNNGTYGVGIYYGGYLYMKDSETPQGGKSELSGTPNPIRLYSAGNIVIDIGYNNIYRSVSGNKDISGTVNLSDTTYTYRQRYNLWNSTWTSPVYGVDYLVTSSVNGGPIRFGDNNSTALSCAEKSGTDEINETDNTSEIETEINQAIKLMNQGQLIASVSKFNEIITEHNSYASIEEYLSVKRAYDYINLAFSKVYEKNIVSPSIGLQHSTVQKMLDVNDRMIANTDQNSNYKEYLFMSLDKAHTYRLAGRPDLAIEEINNILTWTQEEDYEYIKGWLCVNQAELDLKNGILTLETFDDALSSCNAINARFAANSDINAIESDAKLSNAIIIAPNPVTSTSIITTSVDEKAGKAELHILNAQGITVKTYNVNAGVSKIEINNNDFSSGVYWLQLYVNGVPEKTKKIITIK